MNKNKCLYHQSQRFISPLPLFFCWCFILVAAFFFALTSCSRPEHNRSQGYIEGRYTYIATSVSGILKEITVSRGNFVQRGQTLFTLDPQPETDEFRAAFENSKQAVAARDAIAANLEYAKLTYERYRVLLPKHAIEQAQLDNARSILNANMAQLAEANAKIASATARLAQAKWTQEQKSVTSPVDALVFDTYYRLGEFTEARKPILSLLAPEDIKVIFFISELDLGSIKLGDAVEISCDGCKTTFPAKISFISPFAEFTPPVIYSEKTNYKLIYRIEAAFKPQDAYQLHPGQPVSVKYFRHG